jgi:predicted Zn finger-like uncharacterized protein
MIVRCDQCNLVGKVADAKIPEKGVFARCKRCANRIFVRKEPEISVKRTTCPRCGFQVCGAAEGPSRAVMQSRMQTRPGHRTMLCEKCGGEFREDEKNFPASRGNAKTEQSKLRIGWDRGYFLLIFLLFTVLLNSNGRDGETIGQSSASSANAQKTRLAESPFNTAYLPQDLKRVLIREMEARYPVKHANIREEITGVILSLEVYSWCHEQEARDLGEDFLRLYVALSRDESKKPADRIGETKYDYRIGVAKSRNQFVTIGTKHSTSDGIRWN